MAKFEGAKVVDIHDLQWTRIRNTLKIKKAPSVISSFKLWKFKRSEKSALRKFDTIIAISKSEMSGIKELACNQTDVRYLPATFDIKSVKQDLPEQICHDLLFVGSNSDPNRDGLIWFLDKIFRNILKHRPDTTLRIVGRISSNEQVKPRMAAFSDRIMIEGFVEDIATVYHNSKVVICPITYGTGMKIKTVEALTHSCAVVGTSIAFDSIDVKNGHDAFVEDDADSFCNGVLQLLSNSELRNSMRERAKEVSRRDHSFETAISVFGRI
ncbi:glycosyltransferase family 4 protein [Roseibium sp. RKSG952]|uniref:glycosyltransferase family 4 protein n=1 Tax=Roseibium sp. RKSG952 TaxID=2529384 RepID=UPI0018AD1753|nr:glycosyltransferase family 4 protein [Roseibium sp. RKSG952]